MIINQSQINHLKRIFFYEAYYGHVGNLYTDYTYQVYQSLALSDLHNVKFAMPDPVFCPVHLYRAIHLCRRDNNLFQFYFFPSLKEFRCN